MSVSRQTPQIAPSSPDGTSDVLMSHPGRNRCKRRIDAQGDPSMPVIGLRALAKDKGLSCAFASSGPDCEFDISTCTKHSKPAISKRRSRHGVCKLNAICTELRPAPSRQSKGYDTNPTWVACDKDVWTR
ncbi:hypothetical protein J1614_004089 [Plenodomus biglobosus]|nr:hypothetical protein J1614_004089 [Plenodomus biglobosus]